MKTPSLNAEANVGEASRLSSGTTSGGTPLPQSSSSPDEPTVHFRPRDTADGALHLAFSKVAAALGAVADFEGLHGRAVYLTRAEIVSLADWHRRAWQETHTPYQAIWKDRAISAETALERMKDEVRRMKADHEREFATYMAEREEHGKAGKVGLRAEVSVLCCLEDAIIRQLTALLPAEEPTPQVWTAFGIAQAEDPRSRAGGAPE